MEVEINFNFMKACVFPGQGAQFVGMGKDVYDYSSDAKEMFENANEILGFKITDIMFNGSDEDLKQTKVTQPAIFLHSVILANCLGNKLQPDMVAGHSLGEFSALVANKALDFEAALKLVLARATAMQKACEAHIRITHIPSSNYNEHSNWDIIQKPKNSLDGFELKFRIS